MSKNFKFNNVFFAAMVYVAWVIIFSIYNYQTSKAGLLSELDKRLEISARNYINIIPDNLHNKNMSKGDLTKHENYQLVLISNEYAKTNGMEYLYSIIKRDNKVYFTMGNATEEDMVEEGINEVNGGGYYFVPYEAEPHYHKAFNVIEPIFHNTHDKWGDFRTVLIQHQSKDGTKFVIGADVKTSYIDDLLWEELIQTFIISILFLFFAIPLMLAVSVVSRRLAEKLESRVLERTAELEKRADELVLANEKINIANHELHASTQQLKFYRDQSPMATIDWNTDFQIMDWNEAAETMFGYTLNEVKGHNFVDIMLPASAVVNVKQVWKDLIAQTGGNTSINENITKDGRTILCEWHNRPIINELGKVIGAASIVENITERKKAEQEIIRAKEEAVQANNAKSDFLSSMSHELRTPLNAVLGFAQLIEIDTKDEVAKNNSHEIIIAGKHLLQLISQVLELSKIESGNMDISIKNHSFNEIFKDTMSLIQPIADKSSIQICNNVSPSSDISIDVDKIKYKQVLLNVLSNAIKYNSENGKVTIDCSTNDENMLCLSIKDSGKGLTAEQQVKIFLPFDRAGKENSNIEGTGLGLAISKNLIEQMDGTITVESEVGKGSCFVIQVPLS